MIFWMLSFSWAQETTCDMRFWLSSIQTAERQDDSYDSKYVEPGNTSVYHRPLLDSQEYSGQRFPVYPFDTLHLAVESNIENTTEDDDEIASLSVKSSVDGLLQQRKIATVDMPQEDPSSFVFSLSPGKHKITTKATTKLGMSCSQDFYIHVTTKPKPLCFWRDVNGTSPREHAEDTSNTTDNSSLVYVKKEKQGLSRLTSEIRYDGDHSDIQVQIVDRKSNVLYSGSPNRDGLNVIEIAALNPPMQLALNAQSSNGSNCSQTLNINKEESVINEESNHSNFGYEQGDLTIFQGGLDLSWYFKGGQQTLAMGFSSLQTHAIIPLSESFPSAYIFGYGFDIAGASQYTNETFFARFGLLNGLSLGPVSLMSGGGIGTATWKRFDVETGVETKLFLQDTPVYWYWDNRILLLFGDVIKYGVQGSYEPRWYMQNNQPVNRSMWSAGLVLGLVRVGYEQWYMPDDNIMSSWKIMFGTMLGGS